jgi:ABC-type transport system involved in multi-copper enzyme maturation permease subunit
MRTVLQREFFSMLRMRNAAATLVGLTATFSLIVLLRWPTDGRVDLSGARAQQVFQVFTYTLLAGTLFVVPAFPAVSMVQEKKKRTLELLLNSPLRPWAIFFGKLCGTMLFSTLLLLTSLPAAAACVAMGGVDLVHQVGLLYAVLLVCILQYSSIALLVSTYAQTSDAAVRLTYAIVFAVSVLAIGPHFLLQGQPGLLATVAWWMRAASPLPIVMDIAQHAGVGTLNVTSQVSTINAFFVLAGVSSVVFAIATITRLNHRLFDQSRSKGKITDDRRLVTRSFRRLMYLVDPQRRKAGIPFFLNPVMVKEFRTRRFGRMHWVLRLVAACAMLSLLLTFAAAMNVVDWGVETIGGFMVLLQIVLIVLITPALAAGLISSEREYGGWVLLRMTPMSTMKIIRGKLLSVIWTVALILLATLPGYVVMIYIRPVMWLQVYLVMICLVVAAAYTISVAAAVGSLFKKTATATMTSYAVLIVVFLGPLLIWMGRDAPFSHDIVQSALSINPTGAALSVIETPGFESYELVPLAWWLSGLIAVFALLGLFTQVWRISRPL